MIIDVTERRKKIYALMPFASNDQIAQQLGVREAVVERDIEAIQKKISEERDKLATRAHIERGMLTCYQNYQKTEYPENIQWLSLYEKFVKDWLLYNRTVNITFLQQNNEQNNLIGEGGIEELVRIQEEFDGRSSESSSS